MHLYFDSTALDCTAVSVCTMLSIEIFPSHLHLFFKCFVFSICLSPSLSLAKCHHQLIKWANWWWPTSVGSSFYFFYCRDNHWQTKPFSIKGVCWGCCSNISSYWWRFYMRWWNKFDHVSTIHWYWFPSQLGNNRCLIHMWFVADSFLNNRWSFSFTLYSSSDPFSVQAWACEVPTLPCTCKHFITEQYFQYHGMTTLGRIITIYYLYELSYL